MRNLDCNGNLTSSGGARVSVRLEGCSRRTGNCSNRVGLSEMPASEAYDVVVIGAGAGGMTAAAVAAAEGLSVLVIEKTEFVGGTTSWSGGMVWIPVNSKMKQAVRGDAFAAA